MVAKIVSRPCEPIEPSLGVSSLELFLCTGAEQAFIKGCRALAKGHEERARIMFAECTKMDPKFFDAWFMYGMIELTGGRIDRAREAFLHILADEDYFQGILIVKFLPTYRAFANLFEDYLFQIAPTTGDVAAVTARM